MRVPHAYTLGVPFAVSRDARRRKRRLLRSKIIVARHSLALGLYLLRNNSSLTARAAWSPWRTLLFPKPLPSGAGERYAVHDMIESSLVTRYFGMTVGRLPGKITLIVGDPPPLDPRHRIPLLLVYISAIKIDAPLFLDVSPLPDALGGYDSQRLFLSIAPISRSLFSKPRVHESVWVWMGCPRWGNVVVSSGETGKK